jgi:conserved hypothetical protein
MKSIQIEIKNGYGIVDFKHKFEYKDGTTGGCCNFYGLYAQNGTMKSSFAKTLFNYSKGVVVSDEIYQIPGSCVVSGIEQENILSYPSYDGRVYLSENATYLVANQEAKKVYAEASKDVIEAFNKLKSKISEVTKKKDDDSGSVIEDYYYRFVSKEQMKSVTLPAVITLLRANLPEIKQGKAQFCDISLNVFNSSNFKKFITNKKYSGLFGSLVKAYDEMRASPTYYREGFDSSSAHTLIKALEKSKYFNAKHEVVLKDGEDKRTKNINNKEELENYLKTDFDRIIELYPNLKAALNQLIADFSVGTNGEVRRIIEDKSRRDILLFMGDEDRFYKNMWFGYLSGCIEEIESLLKVHDGSKSKIEEALKKADNADTEWQDVIDIFNDRFSSLPYRIDIANKKDAIVEDLVSPIFEFKFRNPRNPSMPYKERPDNSGQLSMLGRVLSNGERKALYLLNIIFDVKKKLKDGVDTLLVLDDVVESFDYRNKYAFFEYLQELASQNSQLYIISLTHNFDFFRLVYEKLYPKNEKQFRLVISDENNNLSAKEMFDPRVFGSCKKDAAKDKSAWVTMIPFARNIVEFQHDKSHDDYKKLTRALHTLDNEVTVGHVQQYLQTIVKVANTPFDKSLNIHKAIIMHAKEVAAATSDGFSLKDNLVLAIGTRLCIERYIINKISEEDYRNAVSKERDLTRKLLILYGNNCSDPNKQTYLKIFNKAAAIVDGAIHINSFMYEPLVDVGTWEMKKIFNKIYHETNPLGEL